MSSLAREDTLFPGGLRFGNCATCKTNLPHRLKGRCNAQTYEEDEKHRAKKSHAFKNHLWPGANRATWMFEFSHCASPSDNGGESIPKEFAHRICAVW